MKPPESVDVVHAEHRRKGQNESLGMAINSKSFACGLIWSKWSATGCRLRELRCAAFAYVILPSLPETPAKAGVCWAVCFLDPGSCPGFRLIPNGAHRPIAPSPHRGEVNLDRVIHSRQFSVCALTPPQKAGLVYRALTLISAQSMIGGRPRGLGSFAGSTKMEEFRAGIA